MTQEVLRTPVPDRMLSGEREITLSALTKVRPVHPDLQELVERKSLPDWGRKLLLQSLADGKNIIIGGRVCSGKTTLLGALIRERPINETMMLIDEDRELAPSFRGSPNIFSCHGDYLSTVQLIQIFQDNAPDRLAISEIRGAAAYDYLKAVNQARNARNWRGLAFTIHAESARQIMHDFLLYIGKHPESRPRPWLTRLVGDLIDLVVYVRKYPSQDGSGRYVVDRIMSVGVDSHGDLEYETLLSYDDDSQRFNAPCRDR